MFRFQGFVIVLRFQGPGFYFVGVLDFGAASSALELRGLCNVALCFGIFIRDSFRWVVTRWVPPYKAHIRLV